MCFEWWSGGAWITFGCAGCTSAPTDVTAVATPNPIYVGQTLNLNGSATGATSWSWTGPNGFTSTLQNPTIPNITTAGAGVYTLTASNACGSATATTATVTVITTTSSLIYVIGGVNYTINSSLKVNEVYDPSTNTWSTKAAMPTARHGIAAVT